jgi:hypothetical protein
MKNQTFLIRADNGRECVMRLPVDKYGGITAKGFKVTQARFYDGATNTTHGLQYALNLEAFSTSDALLEAIIKYKQHII